MDWIPLLEQATTRFASVAAAGDLTAPVPACPEWSLADLVQHLGEVHLWAAHAVEHGTPDGDDRFDGSPDELVEWYGGTARRLIAVLAAAGPEDPAWAFGPQKVAGFWHRRQVHETLVHEYDALAAAGREDTWSVDAAIAWDGVDEVATIFYPRQVRLGRTAPLEGTLRLAPTDVADATLDIGTAQPVAEVTGRASYLLLALWKRVTVEEPDAAELLRSAITP